MTFWEADFYRRPLQDDAGQPLWELLICDPAGTLRHSAVCPQPQVNADWLVTELTQLANTGQVLPDTMRVFRSQTFNLLELAAQRLGFAIEPTRRTPTLKDWLRQRALLYPTFANYNGQAYDPIAIDHPPPLPLPETLWGDTWRFASLPAADLMDAFCDRWIPILEMPAELVPLKLGLASTTLIPGVVIDGGRQSMRLASWIQQSHPDSLNYMAGAPDGLILETGLCDRWVVATFDDPEVTRAAQTYEGRKQQSQGLHFLLVQPDDSGMTYSGFWLLQTNQPLLSKSL